MNISLVYTDFDGTLVFSNSFVHLIAIRKIAYQEKKDIVSGLMLALSYLALPLLLLLHLCHETLRDYATYCLYFGLSNDEIYKYARLYWRSNQDRLNPNVVNFLEAQRSKGSSLVIVSGSLVEIIQAAITEFKLNHLFDAVIGAELLPAAHGLRYPARILKSGAMIGANKVVAIRTFERELTRPVMRRTAITDSVSDLALLLAVDDGYLVRPSRRLRVWGSRLNCVEI